LGLGLGVGAEVVGHLRAGHETRVDLDLGRARGEGWDSG